MVSVMYQVQNDRDLESANPVLIARSDQNLEVLPCFEVPEQRVNMNPVLQNMIAKLDLEFDLSAAQDRNYMAESTNPVLRNPLMQLTAEDFQNCRITPYQYHRRYYVP